MLAAETKRAKGVDDYAMDIGVMGHETTLYYERGSMRGPNAKAKRRLTRRAAAAGLSRAT
jgi:hypothetical protein